jgi:hypothetical protein
MLNCLDKEQFQANIIIKDIKGLFNINLKYRTKLNKDIILLRENIEGFLKLYKNCDFGYIMFISS